MIYQHPLAYLLGLPRGTALDAACGTGRHAGYLVSLGHDVIGVDSSPEMLAVARAKIPGGDFREGDLRHLPVPDRHADVVVRPGAHPRPRPAPGIRRVRSRPAARRAPADLGLSQ